MSTSSYLLHVGLIEAVVVRKPIKHVHLAVLPPAGRVRVTAPLGMQDDAIRVLLATRLPWIKKQQAKFAAQERQTERAYVSGETHFLFGKPYRLEVVTEDRPPRVALKGKRTIRLYVRPGASRAKRDEVITEWYREVLREVLQDLMRKWQRKVGARPSAWGIRRMKTRWGSCSERSRRIWLNLELAKKPIACIEYVVVHEIVHLLEAKHTERFSHLMSRYLPKWRSRKEELNRFMLSHEEWGAK